MELAGEARARHLEQACADDPALRAEVERLLAAHEGHDPLLDAALASHAPPVVTAAPLPPRAASADRADAGRLPAELMDRAARRLSTMALLYAVGFVLAYSVRELTVHVVGRAHYQQALHTPGQVITASFTLFAAVVALLLRQRRLPPWRLIYVATLFEILGSLGIALASYSSLGTVWGVSWLCVWIMMFPLVIPMPAGAAAIGAFSSAATGVLAILLWGAALHFYPPAVMILGATVPNFVVAALACLGARQIYRVGVELGEARRLGRYRLVAPLGHGGMGEVWIAEHDLLARPAALKLIRPALLERGRPSPAVLERFEREAQCTATLTSPHTVKLYDFGLTDDGLFYYVMELLEGLDLHALVHRHGPVPAARAIHFLRQVCASLAEAHALGLVHRDIKPSNLFVCRQGLEHDVLKVLDFGIARPASDSGREPIEGTPAYMAPEAARGVSTPAADLYSLGGVGLWLLTGELAGDRARMSAEVPSELRGVLRDCLADDPARRPRDAAELAARLGQVPGPRWDAAQAEAWWRSLVAPPGGVSRLDQ